MEILKENYIGIGDVKGFQFNQIARTKEVAIYIVENSHYEVFEIKTRGQAIRNINGKEIEFPSKELYPTSDQFGITAWTIKDYKKALDKYSQLCENKHVEMHKYAITIHCDSNTPQGVKKANNSTFA